MTCIVRTLYHPQSHYLGTCAANQLTVCSVSGPALSSFPAVHAGPRPHSTAWVLRALRLVCEPLALPSEPSAAWVLCVSMTVLESAHQFQQHSGM